MVSECLDVVKMMQCLKFGQQKNVRALYCQVNGIKQCGDGMSK